MSSELIKQLRDEIDRKHREAILALERVAAYVTDAVGQSKSEPKPTPDQSTGKQGSAADLTRVDIVLAAIASEAKTVEQLQDELNLSESSIRAVLYSKFVKSRITRTKIGKKKAFRCKPSPSHSPGKTGEEESAASLTRDALTKNPNGLTASGVMELIGPQLERIGATKAAVTAALYNMKSRGKATHSQQTGVYRLVTVAEKAEKTA